MNLKKSYGRRFGILCLSAVMSAMLLLAQTSGNVQKVSAADFLDDILIKAPDKPVTDFKISSSTMDSVTLTWTKSPDAQTYYISYWESGKPSTSVDKDDLGDVSEYTITNLKQAKYIFQIQPANKLRSGIPLKGPLSTTAKAEGAPSAAAVSGLEFYNIQQGHCSFYIEGLSDIYTSQVQLYDAFGNLLDEYDGEASGAVLEDPVIKNNGFYAVKVRGCYEQAGGYASCGEWTDPYYFSTAIKPFKLSQKNGRITAKWTKVQGAGQYTVYISKKSSDGFKKAASTSSVSASVRKIGNASLKSGKTYYLKVEAELTADGETYTASSAVQKIKMK